MTIIMIFVIIIKKNTQYGEWMDGSNKNVLNKIRNILPL